MNTLDTENKIPENTNIVVDTIQCKNKFARVIELLEPNHISDEDDYNIQ